MSPGRLRKFLIRLGLSSIFDVTKPFEMSVMSRRKAAGPESGTHASEVSMSSSPSTERSPARSSSVGGTAGWSIDMSRFIPGLVGKVRDHGTLSPVLGRMGSLEVRLATTAREIRQAQKLRFTV